MAKPSRFTKLILGITCTLLFAFYGSAPLLLPQPVSAFAPADQFSAERALDQLEILVQTKRVAGSAGMEQTAYFLADTLRSYGLEPEIQEAFSSKGTLRNVVVRLPGQDSSHALLILSHADSISFGAGDNGSGTAVLLELARALAAGKPLRNDIILLFDDGEEQGYLGGYAFARSHRWMKDVDYVIGLDTAAWGPVVLLQTTPGNEASIRAYAESVPNPTAFGFFADADWNISHDTSEIQPFYEQGLPGMALEDPTAFPGKHSDEDTMGQIKPGSLQQMGEQTLSLARYLSNGNLTQTSIADRSYFTLWKIGVIHYPAEWNIAILIFASIGLIVILISDIRSKVFNLLDLLLSTLFLLLLFFMSGVIGLGADKLFGRLIPNTNPYIESYLQPASLPFFMASIVIVVLVYILGRRNLVKRYGAAAVSQAGLIIWLFFSLIAVEGLRVGSYIFTLPLLLAVLVNLLPVEVKFLKITPAAVFIVLAAPNIVLAFLGTGLQTLPLVTILAALSAELWAAALADLSPLPRTSVQAFKRLQVE